MKKVVAKFYQHINFPTSGELTFGTQHKMTVTKPSPSSFW